MEPKEAYTVREVAALTGFSRQTVMRMFEKERGVIILERPKRMHKRGYRSIRIPQHVYDQRGGGGEANALAACGNAGRLPNSFF